MDQYSGPSLDWVISSQNVRWVTVCILASVLSFYPLQSLAMSLNFVDSFQRESGLGLIERL